MSAKVPGTERPIGRATAGALFNTVRKDGTPVQVFRIYKLDKKQAKLQQPDKKEKTYAVKVGAGRIRADAARKAKADAAKKAPKKAPKKAAKKPAKKRRAK